jgi:hypothetical protein
MSDEAPRPLARFDFRGGAEGGSQLMLYGACIVHRSESHLETMPLARVSAISVSFERDRRRLGWGVALVIGALMLLALSGPLGSLAHGAAQEVAASGAGVGRALYGFFRFMEMTAAVLPALSLACALAGAALAGFGWQGSTTFTLTLAGGERTYVSRGRDTQLLDFAEMASERLMAGALK